MEEQPVFEIGVTFTCDRERAEALLELLTELVCDETGGGDGASHVCRGFFGAWLTERKE